VALQNERPKTALLSQPYQRQRVDGTW